MPKIKTVKIYDFETKDFRVPTTTTPLQAIASGIGTTVLLFPKAVFADGEKTANAFGEIFDTVLMIADYGAVFAVIVSGASWMYGHRSKALSLMFDAGCGYLVIRNAQNIVDWIKGLSG